MALVDVRTHRIPNRWMIIGALLSLIEQSIGGHLEGALIGGALAVGVTLIARRLTRGLGLGDVIFLVSSDWHWVQLVRLRSSGWHRDVL